MRDATKEERESINNYIDSISHTVNGFMANSVLGISDLYISKDIITPAKKGIEIYTSKLEYRPAIAKFRINNITIEVCDEESIPNKFRRFVQKLLLGIEWEVY